MKNGEVVELNLELVDSVGDCEGTFQTAYVVGDESKSMVTLRGTLEENGFSCVSDELDYQCGEELRLYCSSQIVGVRVDITSYWWLGTDSSFFVSVDVDGETTSRCEYGGY